MTTLVHERGERAAPHPTTLLTRARERIEERLETNVGPSERLVSTALGGTLLALGLRRPGAGGVLLGVLGGGLVARGLSGHCPVYERLGSSSAPGRSQQDGQVQASSSRSEPEQRATITVGKPAAELFRAWQQPDVQARIMAHFASVSGEDDGRLRWHVRSPLGKVLSFHTQRAEARDNELLVWSSTPDSELESTWSLQLRKAPANYGTELTLVVRFEAATGWFPHMLQRLLGVPARLVIERALRNFKALVESGEIPSTFHNPSARRGARSDAQPAHALRAEH